MIPNSHWLTTTNMDFLFVLHVYHRLASVLLHNTYTPGHRLKWNPHSQASWQKEEKGWQNHAKPPKLLLERGMCHSPSYFIVQTVARPTLVSEKDNLLTGRSSKYLEQKSKSDIPLFIDNAFLFNHWLWQWRMRGVREYNKICNYPFLITKDLQVASPLPVGKQV